MFKTYLYDASSGQRLHDIDLAQLNPATIPPGNLLWLDLFDCSEEELQLLKRIFNFHDLAIEDCLQEAPRAKVDDYEDYYFFVFHALRYSEGSDEEISTIELDVFLGPNYVVTIHRRSLPSVGKIARQSETDLSLLSHGPQYFLYRIVDSIVDDYFPILDRIGARIDELEDEIHINPAKEITEEFLALKRTILLIRKAVLPQMRVFATINGHYAFKIEEDLEPYFDDIGDNLDRIMDTTATYRDLVNGALDAYYLVVSNKTNEVVRVLTIISTIMMPLTYITGLIGMNVPIPFQDRPVAFWIITVLTLGLAVAMLAYFKRRKWI
ncbi:MAG: magnesium/cobalt transporter CorA [Syntrophothermus sp.]